MLNRKLWFRCLALALMLLTSRDGAAARLQPTPEIPPTPEIQPIPETDSLPLHECPTAEQLRQAIKPIGDIRARLQFDVRSVKEEGLPPDCSSYVFQQRQAGRALYTEMTEFNWRPTNFFHQPLYFDDQPLERYGQTLSPTLQPVISGARFFMTVPIVPYKIGINPLHEPISTLGYYRPGVCAPCVREKIMPAFEIDAALLQAATAVALVLILP